MKYDPKTREQECDLKDGRKIFKTHNGFRSYVVSVSGVVTQVTPEYYLKAFLLKKKHDRS
jgi:hypothetical protein